MERDFLCAIGRKGTETGVKEEARAESADYSPRGGGGGGGGAPPMQWQFQQASKSGAAPAFVSFRTARDGEGATTTAATRDFSISGFRPPVGDAFDGIRKHASSSSAPHHQRPFGYETPATAQQHQHYSHRAQASDRGAATTHHHLLVGGSRMVQPLSSRHPAAGPLNQVLRTHSNNASSSGGGGGGLFRSSSQQQPSFAVVSNGFGGSTVGAYGARNPRSQTSTQMTIFYNGTVNVFDNVSVEKAQELMLLASKASVPSSPPTPRAVVRKPDSPISAPAKINVPEVSPARQIVTHQKPEPSVVSHVATASSPISIAPQSGAAFPRSAPSSCTTTDSTRPKTTVVQTPVVVPAATSLPSSPQPTTVATASTTTAVVMPRAVPQARKASLARFLEKRKERVTSVEPYPTSKSLPESSDTTKGSTGSAPSKSSFDIITPTAGSRGEELLRFGQPRNISFGSEACPSTRLQI